MTNRRYAAAWKSRKLKFVRLLANIRWAGHFGFGRHTNASDIGRSVALFLSPPESAFSCRFIFLFWLGTFCDTFTAHVRKPAPGAVKSDDGAATTSPAKKVFSPRSRWLLHSPFCMAFRASFEAVVCMNKHTTHNESMSIESSGYTGSNGEQANKNAASLHNT